MRERIRLIQAITDRSARKAGIDTRSRKQSVGQRRDLETVTTEIQRGNIEWGTLIERGP